jgi:hypothetical protein
MLYNFLQNEDNISPMNCFDEYANDGIFNLSQNGGESID